MDGEISVDSQLGVGALFRIELPFEPASEAEMPRKSGQASGRVVGLAAGQPAFRILIAEDQYENQLLLARLMHDIGLAAKTVEDGEQCVKTFRDWQPDLIWMDRHMPVQDGIEACRHIRGLPGGDKVKIVCVTASVLKEPQSELMAAGMDDLVYKPYREGEIYDCLARQLGIEFVYSEAVATEETIGQEGLTAEKLAVLSGDLRAEFKLALKSLDDQRIAEIVRQAGNLDGVLGKILGRLVDTFDYPQILAVLDKLETLDE
jgi:CheY-like chemotaxis protein